MANGNLTDDLMRNAGAIARSAGANVTDQEDLSAFLDTQPMQELPADFSDVTHEYGVEQNPLLPDAMSEENLLNLSKSHEENLKSLQSTAEPDATRTSYGDAQDAIATPTEEYVTWNKERTASIYKNIKDDIMDGAVNSTGMRAIREGLQEFTKLYPNNPANAYMIPILNLLESSEDNAKSITDNIIDGMVTEGKSFFNKIKQTRGSGKKYLQENYPGLHKDLYEDLPGVFSTMVGGVKGGAKEAIDLRDKLMREKIGAGFAGGAKEAAFFNDEYIKNNPEKNAIREYMQSMEDIDEEDIRKFINK